jgi:hypothetical protein
MAARTLTVDDLNDSERERIGLALGQWNHMLNGVMRLRRAIAARSAMSLAPATIRMAT